MDNLVLDLIEYVKNDADQGQGQELKDLYKSLMYALCDGDYLSTLPEKFQDQKVVEDAYDICYARVTLLDPGCNYYDDVIPEYLSSVTEVESYFTRLVLDEIEEKIDKVFPDNYEYIESECIESVIKDQTFENCEEILKDYVEYMEEEYNQELVVYNNNGDPYIVKYGKIIERAVLDYDKIIEIAETSGSDYFNIEFDWGV